MTEQKTTRKYVHSLKVIPHRPDDEPLVCLKINVYWLAFLIAVIYPSRYPEAWEGTLDENKQARKDVLRLLEIIMEQAGCNEMDCCPENLLIVVMTRVTLDGQIQISIDGGQNWSQSPSDPRATVPSIPPLVGHGDTTKCDAASNGREHVQVWVEDISNRFSTFTTLMDVILQVIGAAMAAILVFLGAPQIAALVELAIQLAQALIGRTQEEWDALWTQDAYDDIVCLLYCNISPDGTFTQSQFERVLEHTLTDLPGAGDTFSVSYQTHELFRVWGLQGLNRACSFGNAANSDCSSCDCSGCDISAWETFRGTETSRTDTHIFVTAELSGGAYYAGVTSPSVNACCCRMQGLLVEGAQPTSIAYIPCGQAKIEENYGFAYSGQSTNQMSWSANAPFSLDISSTGGCD